MRAAVIIILLTFLCSFSKAQETDFKVADKYVELVNKHMKENVLLKKQLEKNSVLGGDVTGHYLKKKLVLITTHYGGEFGYFDHFYYIQNDSLVVVNEKKVILKEPETEKEYAEYEKYLIFNTKNGHADLTKWPLTVDIDNTYYWDNSSIIKYLLKNFNKPVKPGETEIEETTKDLTYRFATHLDELK